MPTMEQEPLLESTAELGHIENCGHPFCVIQKIEVFVKMTLRSVVGLFLFSVVSVTFTGAQEYSGNVGKMEATFFLEWGKDDSVSGEYWYPERKGMVYTLKGANHEPGKMILEEFTGEKKTATCSLTKRVTDQEIIWEGRMINTDGRKFPMKLVRPRDPLARKAGMSGEVRNVEPGAVWKDFPAQNQVTEYVDQGSKGTIWANAKIVTFRSAGGWTEIEFLLNEEESNVIGAIDSGVRFSTKEVKLKLARELPVSAASMIGKNAGLFIDQNGAIEDVFLTTLSITHWRKTKAGPVEVRGFLDSDETAELDMKPVEELRAILPKISMVNLIPDKLALQEVPSAEVFARTIRLNRLFGIVVQMTDAGPGMLELEGISLDPPLDSIPWIFIGEESGWDSIPPTQRVREAG